MSVRVEGLDQLEKKLKQLGSQQAVPATELLTDQFIQRHTKFSSLEEMFKASGFKIDAPEDLKAIPDADWDNFIRSASTYDSWEAMFTEAVGEWTAKKLGLR